MNSRVVPVALAALCLAAGCTGGAPEVAPVDRDAVTARLATVGVSLTTADVDCTVGELERSELDDLADAEADLSFAAADRLATAVTDCSGADTIALASLTAIGGGASEASIECAADAFDGDLVVDLLRGRLTGETEAPNRARLVELEIAVSLGECLTPAELAGLG